MSIVFRIYFFVIAITRISLTDNRRTFTRYVPEPILIARLVLTRNESEVPADRFGMPKAMRIMHERGHRFGISDNVVYRPRHHIALEVLHLVATGGQQIMSARFRQKCQRVFADHAAIHDPNPLACAKTFRDGSDDAANRLHLLGDADTCFVGQRKALRRPGQAMGAVSTTSCFGAC